MLNKTKRCKSKCINLPRDKCYKGCVFDRLGFCRLSGKYKMNPSNCKLMLRTKKLNIRRTRRNDRRYIPESIRMPKKEKETDSYSPEINKLLIQSRFSDKHDIFKAITNCMNINVEEYNINDSILKYFINPRIQLKNGECVTYWHKESRKLFLDALSKHRNININSLIVPKQSYYNCWFNTGFMMNYISDKGRKFNKYFRQYMITGQMRGFKPFVKRLRAPLFLFNIAIEATLQGDSLAKIMNTNDIIEKIHENIPKEHKKHISNKKEFGNPFVYQTELLNYLSDKPYYYNLMDGYVFYNAIKQTGVYNTTKDFVWVEMSDSVSNKINYKPTQFIDTIKNVYLLDSILIRDTTKNHFCCLITVNNEEYIYDGASSPSIKVLKWKNPTFLNSGRNFKMDDKSLSWNMLNGYQVSNYYRV